MFEAQSLRVLIRQRLNAAAEEIFELFERSFAELEEQLCPQHQVLQAVFKPQLRLHRADIQQCLMSQAASPPEQQDLLTPQLGQEVQTESRPPELQHIKEEKKGEPLRGPEEAEVTKNTFSPEEQQGEQLRGLDEAEVTEITLTAVSEKRVEDDEDRHQCSQSHQTSQTEEIRLVGDLEREADDEDCREQEPTRNSNVDQMCDDSCDQDDTRELQPGLISLQTHKEPLLSNFEMEEEETQRQQQTALKKKNMAAVSSSDDEDSDVEKNFALLTKRGGGVEGEVEHHGGEEEDELSDEDKKCDDGSEEEEEEESDAGEEESEEPDRGEEEELGEEGGDSEDSDDDDDDDDEDSAEEAGGSSEIQTREDIKRELSTMSFEDILKLQNKVGTKVYNEVAYGSNKSQQTAKRKRLNKNRPMEISAKRPAPFLRQVVSVRKPTFRDPRFDDLSGEYKPEIFEKTYKFIDDIKHREKESIQKRLKKTKNDKKKEKLQFLLKRMENQERAKKSREQQRERELQFKRQQREKANQGARPFFLKNSEKKKLQLAEKYQELKKSGKLENFLSKKRKRNATKDRRKLPKQAV